ncbi:hypothetical protein RND81_13G147300 [Saponaria officinalis]|uniref:Uncharacterized protein n=1 Tax=Saponaria officinalis TaxID=3572 RepID=A0AAW1GZZ6_SAPOF
MTIFYFPQFEHESLHAYWDRLESCIVQCGYYVDIWEMCHMIYDGVNCETRFLIEQMCEGMFEYMSYEDKWEALKYLAQSSLENERNLMEQFISSQSKVNKELQRSISQQISIINSSNSTIQSQLDVLYENLRMVKKFEESKGNLVPFCDDNNDDFVESSELVLIDDNSSLDNVFVPKDSSLPNNDCELESVKFEVDHLLCGLSEPPLVEDVKKHGLCELESLTFDDDYDLVEHSEDALNVDISPPLNHDVHEFSLDLHENDDMFNDDCNFVKPCELVYDVFMSPLDDMIVLDDFFSLKHDVSDLSTPLCDLGNMLNEVENDESMQFENNEEDLALELKQIYENDKLEPNEKFLDKNEIFNDSLDKIDEIFDDRLEVKWDDDNDDPLNESEECKIVAISGFEMVYPLLLQFEQNDKFRSGFKMIDVYAFPHKLLISFLTSLVYYCSCILLVIAYVHFCEDWSTCFDKLMRSLIGSLYEFASCCSRLLLM